MKTWLSPAKLNLFLYINYRQENGYHHLQTLFQLIDLCDKITIEMSEDDTIQLLTEFDDVSPKQNLIYKAAKLLKEQAYHDSKLNSDKMYGAQISIEKNIPMGAGLGGGSSNAATTLIALNELWKLNYSIQDLMNLGVTLGADVPIFIFGKNAFAEGIGEKLIAVELPECYFFIIKPDVSISTKAVFNHPELIRNTPQKSLSQLMAEPFKNDCQHTIETLYPTIKEYISFLAQFAETRLTGTGSAIFSICQSREEAEKLKSAFVDQFKDNHHFDCFISKNIQ